MIQNSEKDKIIQKLKEQGFRITKQRKLLLDIILEGDCSSCKEIYYKVSKVDGKIGAATVYRMINTLEGIGAISRKNMYEIHCSEEEDKDHVCVVELNDDTVVELNSGKWRAVVQAGMRECGYLGNQKIRNVIVKSPH